MKFRLIESSSTIEYDNEGNPLTPEQSEYFKNSKVRDKQGRLLVCYHGTMDNSKFTVFDKEIAKIGFFFVTKERYNDMTSYYSDGNTDRIYKCYLNLENPFFAYRDVDDPNKIVDYKKEDIYKLRNDGVIVYCLDDWDCHYYNYFTKELEDSVVKNGDIIEIVAKDSKQIKSISNKYPTDNDDINEEYGDLKSDSTEYDSEGNQLTPEQQEFFKDSKIRYGGKLRVMYHASDVDFDVFDKGKVGSGSGGLFGRGFYFGSKQLALNYGSKARAFYLNLKNPYSFYSIEDLMTIIQKAQALGFTLADNCAKMIEEIDDWDFDPMDFLDDVILDDSYHSYGGDFSDLIIASGFDGIDASDEVVAFSPNQIKLTTNKFPTDGDDINEVLE